MVSHILYSLIMWRFCMQFFLLRLRLRLLKIVLMKIKRKCDFENFCKNDHLNRTNGSRDIDIGSVDHFDDFWIQKSLHFYDFWIQKHHHFYNFWIQKYFCPLFMTGFLKKIFKQIYKWSWSSRNWQNGAISGSRNC